MLLPIRVAAVTATTALAATTFLVPAASAANGSTTVGGAVLAGHGLITHRSRGVPAPPRVSAKSYVIADADTGAILAAKDPHGRYRPASTLKILTADTLIPRLDQNKKVKPSWKACNVEGSKVGLVDKYQYTIADLFRGMLMVSGNDAAIAVAQSVPGGLPRTLRLMNANARYLHADDTVAKTPNGLDITGQHSSAYDLALIARDGLRKPLFRKYVGTVDYHFPAPATAKQRKKHKHGGYMIYNHDRLLTQYPGGIGVKNGYTTKANATFVGAARRGGHTILVTLMDSKPFFWDDAKAMLTWGFKARGKVSPSGRLVKPGATYRPHHASHTQQSLTGHGKQASGSAPVLPVTVGVVIVLAACGYAAFTVRKRSTRR